jgi:hypothetical protein
MAGGEVMGNKKILDVCCGGRMFWFDKNDANTLFVDNRRVDPEIVGNGKDARVFSCNPDKVMDFRNLQLQGETFSLVVFDPPHFVMQLCPVGQFEKQNYQLKIQEQKW